MRLVTGYDRDFTTQFFRRTFADLASSNDFSGCITPEEQEYEAGKITDTVVHSIKEDLGSPWVFCELDELARTSTGGVDRVLFDRTERAANQILVFEGIVSHGGLWNIRQNRRRVRNTERYEELASILFQNASRWAYLSPEERKVLHLMSRHVHEWVTLLSLVLGNDFLEMLVAQPSTLIKTV